MKFINLTHTISGEMPFFPGTPKPAAEKFCTIEKEGYTELNLRITTHTGTHIDSPAHIIPGGSTLDSIDIREFTGRAAVLDCTGMEINHGRVISYDAVNSFLNENPNLDFIILKTGWYKKWGVKEYLENFPVLSVSAAMRIVKEGIKCVCFDTISADKVEDSTLPVHKILLGNNLMIAENLTNLDKLTASNFELFLIPLLIENSDGSPIRAFAKQDD